VAQGIGPEIKPQYHKKKRNSLKHEFLLHNSLQQLTFCTTLYKIVCPLIDDPDIIKKHHNNLPYQFAIKGQECQFVPTILLTSDMILESDVVILVILVIACY
jgi:hypothetical protein